IKNVSYKGVTGDLPIGEAVNGSYDEVIDGTGLIAVPSFVDVHVHFRDPGQTEKEDLVTGANAAVAGGYGRVVCEANTSPVIDTVAKVQAFYARVAVLKLPIEVSTKCALTIGQQGEQLVDISELKAQFPEIILSSDGEPVTDLNLLVEAFRAAGDTEIHLHCEETPRSHERIVAALGAGEYLRREPELIKLGIAALTTAGNGKLHIQHVSLAESVELIADAKARGLAVTAEVSPHHLLLCEDDIPQHDGARDANWKMNPPLRSHADMLAMRRALADGTINVIATDHAPHTKAEKAQPWDAAPFGVIGLETAFGACMTLMHNGELTFERLIAAMTGNEKSLTSGVTLIDPNEEWIVNPDAFKSKSKNTPFSGMRFKGRIKLLISGSIFKVQ
ncbi:MAG: dihydroorotase, partial [bacterium]